VACLGIAKLGPAKPGKSMQRKGGQDGLAVVRLEKGPHIMGM